MKSPIEDVEWDSDFFGHKVGKIVVTVPGEFDIEQLLIDNKSYRLVYIVADMALNLPNIPAKLVDRKVTLHQRINETVLDFQADLQIETFDLKKDSYQQLENLALLSGTFSRFKTDENFTNNEYEKLYTQWLRNSVYKQTAFDILVAKTADKITGFVTLEKKSATLSAIGLVAVASHVQGRGIGLALIQEAKKRSLAHSFSEIQVVTQADNSAAFHLYRKADFTPIDMKYIYHYWNV